jgi:hypothetical protein
MFAHAWPVAECVAYISNIWDDPIICVLVVLVTLGAVYSGGQSSVLD